MADGEASEAGLAVARAHCVRRRSRTNEYAVRVGVVRVVTASLLQPANSSLLYCCCALLLVSCIESLVQNRSPRRVLARRAGVLLPAPVPRVCFQLTLSPTFCLQDWEESDGRHPGTFADTDHGPESPARRGHAAQHPQRGAPPSSAHLKSKS